MTLPGPVHFPDFIIRDYIKIYVRLILKELPKVCIVTILYFLIKHETTDPNSQLLKLLFQKMKYIILNSH